MIWSTNSSFQHCKNQQSRRWSRCCQRSGFQPQGRIKGSLSQKLSKRSTCKKPHFVNEDTKWCGLSVTDSNRALKMYIMQIQGANNFLLSHQPICFSNPFREVASLLPLHRLQSSRDWFLKFRAAKIKHRSGPVSVPPPPISLHWQQQATVSSITATCTISPQPTPSRAPHCRESRVLLVYGGCSPFSPCPIPVLMSHLWLHSKPLRSGPAALWPVLHAGCHQWISSKYSFLTLVPSSETLLTCKGMTFQTVGPRVLSPHLPSFPFLCHYRIKTIDTPEESLEFLLFSLKCTS